MGPNTQLWNDQRRELARISGQLGGVRRPVSRDSAMALLEFADELICRVIRLEDEVVACGGKFPSESITGFRAVK